MVHLEPSDLADAYKDSEAYAKDFHEPYDEYDRLAKNKLNPKTDKTMPKVNDGSLAALVKEVPKRVLAQMSTGVITPVESDEEWLKELCNIIWNKTIVPNANSQMSFFDKYRLWLYRAVVYGGAPAYSFFDGSKETPSSDFILPDPRSVYLEDGKLSDLDSDYIFMDVWYKKNQIKSIIKNAKDDDDSSWDVEILEELLKTSKEEKESEKTTTTDRENSTKISGYKLVACFQRGYKAPFYMHVPALGNKVARTWANEDPTGNLPITYMYNDQDLENPYGLSQIALSGPIQNVLDYLTQSFLLATQLGLQPPVQIGGDTSRLSDKSIILAPRQKWRVGDAQVSVINTNSSTYTQYPNNYGLVKTQLMNLQGTTDATVGSASGNPGYSKTHAGVELQQERTNANDNFLRQNAATAFQRMSQSLFNLHVANSEGSEIMRLHGDDLEKMQGAGLIDTDPETNEPSTDEVEIIWDNLRGKYTFEVDANSSIGKNDNEQKDKLIEVLTITAQDPTFEQTLAQSGWKLNKGELYKQLFMKIGIEDWEKVLQQLSEEEQMALEQKMAMQQMSANPTTGEQAPEMPLDEAAQAPVTEEMPPVEEMPVEEEQAGIDPEMEAELSAIIEEYQVEPEQAMAIHEAIQQGIPREEIEAYLMQMRSA